MAIKSLLKKEGKIILLPAMGRQPIRIVDEKYDLDTYYWCDDVKSFRESFFGKCICGTIQKFRHVINNSFHLDFRVLNNLYLKYFKARINLLMTTLIEQYPSLNVNPDYNHLKEQFSMLIPKIIYHEKIIDLQPLYSNRKDWEQLRKKIINNRNNE